MSIIKLLLFLMITAFIFINACTHNIIKDSSIIIIDDVLSHDIKIEEVTTHINKNEILEIQIAGSYSGRKYKKLEYRVEWFDENQIMIDTILSSWKSTPLYRKSYFSFKAVAPSARAKEFRVLIRESIK
jgi:uncharacterized protein YcfL